MMKAKHSPSQILWGQHISGRHVSWDPVLEESEDPSAVTGPYLPAAFHDNNAA